MDIICEDILVQEDADDPPSCDESASLDQRLDKSVDTGDATETGGLNTHLGFGSRMPDARRSSSQISACDLQRTSEHILSSLSNHLYLAWLSRCSVHTPICQDRESWNSCRAE